MLPLTGFRSKPPLALPEPDETLPELDDEKLPEPDEGS
jgi:hypothetical protein